jgi:hypothetical protein
MRGRRSLLFFLFVVLLCGASSALFAQVNAQLQLALVGNGSGPYYAPVGQTTQLKIEIFDLGPGDVFLIRGETSLDPNLDGNWQLAHSEDLGNFHVAKFQSALWTFGLQMPSHVQAQNMTNGVPQVELLVKIVYSTTDGNQHSAEAPFLLSVPGAGSAQTDYSIYLVPIVGLVVVALAIIIVTKVRSRSVTKK